MFLNAEFGIKRIWKRVEKVPIGNIFFSTWVNLENESNLYSACSIPIKIVLETILGMIIGKDAWSLERQSGLVRTH